MRAHIDCQCCLCNEIHGGGELRDLISCYTFMFPFPVILSFVSWGDYKSSLTAYAKTVDHFKTS